MCFLHAEFGVDGVFFLELEKRRTPSSLLARFWVTDLPSFALGSPKTRRVLSLWLLPGFFICL